MVNFYKISLRIIIVLSVVFPFNIFGQTDTSLLFKDQVRFSYATIFYDGFHFSHAAKKLVKSYPAPSYEYTLSVSKYLTNNYNLNIGIGYTNLAFFTYYHFEAPKNSVFYYRGSNILEDYGIERDYPSFVFPVSIQKIIKKDTRHYYSLEMGIRYTHTYSFDEGIDFAVGYEVEKDSTTYGLLHIVTDDLKHDFFSFVFKAGLIKLTKKQHSLHLNFVLSYSPDKISEGWYRFYNLPFESYGTVVQRLNYAGVEVAYGFSVSRRKNQWADNIQP